MLIGRPDPYGPWPKRAVKDQLCDAEGRQSERCQLNQQLFCHRTCLFNVSNRGRAYGMCGLQQPGLGTIVFPGIIPN